MLSRYRLMLVRETDLAEPEPPTIDRPERVVDYLWRHVFHDEPREVFAVLFADSFNRATGHLIAFTGTRRNVPIGMHQVFAPAILANAAAIVVAHNHVSGVTTPSSEDMSGTHDLWAAGRLLRIPLHDHLIIASREHWLSLRSVIVGLERGTWRGRSAHSLRPVLISFGTPLLVHLLKKQLAHGDRREDQDDTDRDGYQENRAARNPSRRIAEASSHGRQGSQTGAFERGRHHRYFSLQRNALCEREGRRALLHKAIKVINSGVVPYRKLQDCRDAVSQALRTDGAVRLDPQSCHRPPDITKDLPVR
jgi:RadC-like JAB domain